MTQQTDLKYITLKAFLKGTSINQLILEHQRNREEIEATIRWAMKTREGIALVRRIEREFLREREDI